MTMLGLMLSPTVRTDPQMTLLDELGNYKQRVETELHYFDNEQQPMAHQAIDACVMHHSYDVYFALSMLPSMLPISLTPAAPPSTPMPVRSRLARSTTKRLALCLPGNRWTCLVYFYNNNNNNNNRSTDQPITLPPGGGHQ